MNIKEIQALNKERAALWHEGAQPWSGADWSNAMCGEAGEAANVVKKLRRLETNINNAQFQNKVSYPDLINDLGEEIADTFLYLLLLATYYEIDVDIAVARKFNKTSEANNFPQYLVV